MPHFPPFFTHIVEQSRKLLTLNNLSAYYTPQLVAKFLISKIRIRNAKRILDLCVGSGNLLEAARRKWISASLVGVDIDPNAVANCNKRFSEPALFLQGDARLLYPGHTNSDYPELAIDSFDVVLANPPFAQNGRNEPIEFRASDFDSSHLITNWMSLCRRMEAQLLVYNTLYVRDGGYLVAIIPNSILSCDRFSSLRNWLVAQSENLEVIRLPEKIFRQSQVSASALILKRKSKALPSKTIHFTFQEAKFRSGTLMSKTLYKGNIKNTNTRLDLICQSVEELTHFRKLNEFASAVKRGTFIPKSSLGTVGSYHYIHSTSIKDYGLDLKTKPSYVTDQKAIDTGVYIQNGDILLVRVGKTLGKVGVVAESDYLGLISSCLFLIRPKGIDPYLLALLLQCKISQKYYHAIARGSAAKFLTYVDVRETPIPYLTTNSLIEFAQEYEAALRLPIDSGVGKQRRAERIKKVVNVIDSVLED